MARCSLSKAKRIVVKVGTNLLVTKEAGLNDAFLSDIVRQIMSLRKQGKEVILVTSGAIGAGRKRLGISQMPRDAPTKQACAAVGQGILMRAYDEKFEKLGQPVAQVLLTEDDFSSRERYLNLKNALDRLLGLGVLPIINENDTVSIHELEERAGWVAQVPFSDNDKLSGLVAAKVHADLLVILSDVDGFYDKNPQIFPDAKLVPLVPEITPAIEEMAGGSRSGGRGGMVTKLQGAKIAASSGVSVVIANGKAPDALARAVRGEAIGTMFLPKERTLAARKRWIAYASSVKGAISVNECARDALRNGKSLLPVGITGCRGEFQARNVVSIECGKEFALGICEYSADEVRNAMGAHTSKVAGILGKKMQKEVVMHHNLVFSESF